MSNMIMIGKPGVTREIPKHDFYKYENKGFKIITKEDTKKTKEGSPSK